MAVHVDMSQKFYNKTTIGIACVTEDKSTHKGMALSRQSIKKLIHEVNADHDFARVYAICIFLLLKDYPEKIQELIVCNDEPFSEVKEYLGLLFSDFSKFSNISIISISEHKERLGKKNKFRSLADGLARSYRKRALKPSKWNQGKKLNVVKVTCEDIFLYWNKINEKL